jgi:histidinol-phosphate phosphatase family protein
MKAVIIAGGKGNRLKPLSRYIPKPLIEIAGKPILEHQINLLGSYGINDILILTGYLGHEIKDYFCGRKTHKINIAFYQEEIPLGTSGCIKVFQNELHSDFLVLYGDVMLNFKINDFIGFHRAKGGSATLIVHPNDHPHDSDLIIMDEDYRITDFVFKESKPEYYRNLVSAGVYILSPSVFKYIPEGISDLVEDVFPAMLKNSEKLYGYKTSEYLKDMGTFKRLDQVRNDFLSEKIKRFSKLYKRPAIFMDRDGTIVKEVEFLNRVQDLELFPFSAASIKKINKSDYLSFLITNQSVVARNLCDISTLRQIHDKLETLLGRKGAFLNDIYFCPHHPDKGYPEENQNYKIDCNCRKPKIGLINKAVEEYNVDITSSWFIGDTSSDIQTGINANLKTILVRTGRGRKDNKIRAIPDFVFDNIRDAIDFILDSKPKFEDISRTIIKKNLGKNKRKPFIISVGGLARSGKSTFVKILSDFLIFNSISTSVINLDNWLVEVDRRNESMTVRERYKYKEIENDFNKLLKSETILMNLYDPYSRTIIDKQNYSLKNNKCAIIAGVPALDIEGLRKQTDIKIYIEVDESIRKERFFFFYKMKDLKDKYIKELYNKRLKDEASLIIDSKKYADFIIKY